MDERFQSIYEDDAAITIAKVSPDGTTTVVNTIPVEGAAAPPCAELVPERPLAAFSRSPKVWLVDTQTREVHTLAGYDVTDLDWRPGTDELAIAQHEGDDSRPWYRHLRTDHRRHPVAGCRGRVRHRLVPGRHDPRVHPDRSETNGDRFLACWLADADGSNERVLADRYRAIHGIGPVWSPAGDRLAYQRSCTMTSERQYDQEHPGVLPDRSSASRPATRRTRSCCSPIDDDSANPAGTEVVIQPHR